MVTTQVQITYGEKELDCTLSFEPPYQLSNFYPTYIPCDCEFTLENVRIVCKLQLNFDGKKLIDVTHLEDITSMLADTPIWDNIEELSINEIMERGYV